MREAPPAYWLNPFDVQFELWLNHFANQVAWFDRLILAIDGSYLVTSVVVLFLMWLAVFDRRTPGRLRPGYDVAFASMFLAMLVTLIARALALSLPFRPRPIAVPSLDFALPGGGTILLINWSSFPSDHAVLFYALSAGLFIVSRKLGLIAFAWTTFVICFPRLYLGEHWPTDIVAAAAMGIAFAQLARVPALLAWTRRLIEPFHRKHPDVFFAALFVCSYEASVLFEDVRKVLFLIAHKH